MVVGRGLLAVKPWGECDAERKEKTEKKMLMSNPKRFVKKSYLFVFRKEEFTTEMKDDCASGRHGFQPREKPCYWSFRKPPEIHMIYLALPLGRIAR